MYSDTLLLRQIHPDFVERDGQVSYVAFRPFPRDEGKLSAYDGDQVTAEAETVHQTLRSTGIGPSHRPNRKLLDDGAGDGWANPAGGDGYQ